MPERYRKKPVVIEAEQLTEENAPELAEWCGGNLYRRGMDEGGPLCILIITLKYTHRADIGDWIAKGAAGEFYLVPPDLFAETYEKVDDAEPYMKVAPHVPHRTKRS